jgi:hypothetical protein
MDTELGEIRIRPSLSHWSKLEMSPHGESIGTVATSLVERWVS